MADTLLETAVANWSARFSANGVDPSDYQAITSSLSRWDDWCDAWCAAARVHRDLGRLALAEGHARTAGEALARAATYFHFAKFLFVHDLPRAKAAHDEAVAALIEASPLLDPAARRVEIPFGGHHLVGVLRSPAPSRPMPTVILIPGLDSAKEEFREVERAFLERGMATFSVDGPGQGESEWIMPIRADWENVAPAILDAVAALAEVDSDRIGVWGVSLGGYYATRMATAGLNIRATVSLSGPYDLGAAWDGLNPLTRRAFEVRSEAADAEHARALASELSMAGLADRVSGELLVITGRRDRLFDWRDAERLASEVGRHAELWVLDEGNHGCANVVYRHRPQSADWLAHRLGASTPENEQQD